MDVRRSYNGGNTTGFSSPAADHLDGPIDLSEALDLRKPGRYPVRVSGDALIGRGIRSGDILITDAAERPFDGAVVVVMVDGDVLVAEIERRGGAWWIRGEGADSGREVPEDAEVWAVARALVRTTI
ncbi:S24 family peptidase [Acidiphilium sp. C61]|uniref:S24 family peptidase n=1 Tax=Acidiphilium sp. C61 TaxID=1671485 RepID=UPI00157A9F1C|nr:S24 family peptidase [Acidiphilium sp. C61]